MEHVEHAAVVRHDLRVEQLHAGGVRVLGEVGQQERAEAPALERVGHREGHLGDPPGGGLRTYWAWPMTRWGTPVSATSPWWCSPPPAAIARAAPSRSTDPKNR